ncbi:sensor histidine kinase [Fulvivirga lutea]|uniref:Histidine kinase n=1 Tax=Fulvivirga lutea TaxID=2810512 RepID=A0A974WM72_9BACT|nr:histidine kinase [Fulvivirga lutea]QSE97983.1 histidine kinase [Fulvivirga lutea]
MMFTHRLRYLFILLLSVYSFLNILFTEGNKLFGFSISNVTFFAVILVLVAFIWEGNRLVEKYLIQPVLSKKVHPLIIFFLLSVVYVAILSLASTFILSRVFSDTTHQILTFKLTLGFTFRVNLFLHCINAIYFFINQYNTTQLLAEKLKKESAEAQFAALRNQVNPHFLFNSFNVLSTLVYKDADTASKFIDQLSEVYRYLLQNQQNKVVSLRDELKFLQSYIFLQKIRFQDNLDITIKLDDTILDTYVAPATLQLLIENAIKHNVVSKSNPLQVVIKNQNNFIVVENSLNLKSVKEESTQIGLKNIRSRYNYLCGDDAIITNSNGVFTVKIPIIPEL